MSMIQLGDTIRTGRGVEGRVINNLLYTSPKWGTIIRVKVTDSGPYPWVPGEYKDIPAKFCRVICDQVKPHVWDQVWNQMATEEVTEKKTVSCTCGAAAVRGFHSTWCDIQ